MTIQSNEVHYSIQDCSLGKVLVGMTAKGICAIFIDDDEEVLMKELADRGQRAPTPNFTRKVGCWGPLTPIIDLIENPSKPFDMALDVRGTDFQRRVWQALREIPAGETRSYTDIAKSIGSPKAVRAVAGACAANRIAVVIPCHRVIKHDGSVSGYRWGVERKKLLLAREQKKGSSTKLA